MLAPANQQVLGDTILKIKTERPLASLKMERTDSEGIESEDGADSPPKHQRLETEARTSRLAFGSQTSTTPNSLETTLPKEITFAPQNRSDSSTDSPLPPTSPVAVSPDLTPQPTQDDVPTVGRQRSNSASAAMHTTTTTSKVKSRSMSTSASSPRARRKFRFKFKNMFKPWKWRAKKPAPAIEKIQSTLERKISLRPNRMAVISTGIVKETDVHADATVIRPDGVVATGTDEEDTKAAAAAIPTVVVIDNDDADDKDEKWTEDDGTTSLKERQSSIKGKLARRPDAGSLREKNIIKDEDGNPVLDPNLLGNLERKLSSRAGKTDLEDRNIYKDETPEQAVERKKSLRGILMRRLSQRKSAKELQKNGILKFHEYVDVYNACGAFEYNRQADKPWTRLTNADKIAIKKELNEFKRDEMVVHDDSKKFTRFHK
eukprot:m.39535 g.39535  ORF g.39535 m.39535 type:complete len:432 (-) comp18225_c0_seq1:40-1335(-)